MASVSNAFRFTEDELRARGVSEPVLELRRRRIALRVAAIDVARLLDCSCNQLVSVETGKAPLSKGMAARVHLLLADRKIEALASNRVTPGLHGSK